MSQALSPSQYERLKRLADCALFQHFHPLSSKLLDLKAFDPAAQAFSARVAIDDQHLTSLGLVPTSEYARLLEDAVIVLGYILTGSLLLPVRVEADYFAAIGPRSEVLVRACQLRRRGALHQVEIAVHEQEVCVARAVVTAAEVHTLPEATQCKVVEAARLGLLDEAILLEFVHLFEPRRYLEAREALKEPREATRSVPAAQEAPR